MSQPFPLLNIPHRIAGIAKNADVNVQLSKSANESAPVHSQRSGGFALIPILSPSTRTGTLKGRGRVRQLPDSSGYTGRENPTT